MVAAMTPPVPLQIAVVGGGIVGLVLAAGLVRRNVDVKVYEQAQSFREIGAGIAFTANAIQCMELINPEIVAALRSGGSVATSDDKDDPNDYLRWIDGVGVRDDQKPAFQKIYYKINAGYKGFEGCRRDQFLEGLVKRLPENIISLKKRLNAITEIGNHGRLRLDFIDGTHAEADAVIACDGIKSRVRELMLGPSNPASYPTYTHKLAYRALIPMVEATRVLGEYKAKNQHIHIGPNAHLIHYPVANGRMINATAFITDPSDWPSNKELVAMGVREDLESAFRGWHPSVRGIIKLFPSRLEKWAVFDLWDHPCPAYNRGTVCLAGDAAHASSPHHGAGACMGIEDALCLNTLVESVQASVAGSDRGDRGDRGRALAVAFETYDSIRRARSQWLVNSSRRVCDLYHQPEWEDTARWTKAETCFEEIQDRSFKIWRFDYRGMMRDAGMEYERRLIASEERDGGSMAAVW